MSKLEADVEDTFVRYVSKFPPCQALKLRIDGKNGFPDRTIILPNGTVFFIEFKKPGGGVLSPQQTEMIKFLRECKHAVYIIDDIREAVRVFDKHWERYCDEDS